MWRKRECQCQYLLHTLGDKDIWFSLVFYFASVIKTSVCILLINSRAWNNIFCFCVKSFLIIEARISTVLKRIFLSFLPAACQMQNMLPHTSTDGQIHGSTLSTTLAVDMYGQTLNWQARVRNPLKSNTIWRPRSQLNIINLVCKINFGWELIGNISQDFAH